MTIQPSASSITSASVSTIEDIFVLGYTRSDIIKVYSDEKTGMEITVQFRTLTHTEIKDVCEALYGLRHTLSQVIVEKIETLARAIVTLNGSPLILDEHDRENFAKLYKHEPTSLDMAKYVLIEKIKSILVINALYEAYEEFLGNVTKQFEDIKKKLKNQDSSDLKSF